MSFYDKKFAGGMVTRFGKIQKFYLKQKVPDFSGTF